MSAKETRLFFDLQRTAGVLKHAADRSLIEAAGVTTAQAAVLGLVSERGPVRQNVLAGALGLNESAMAQMAKKLLERDFLAREREAGDKRAWRLSLTAAGEAAVKAAEARFKQVNAALDAELTDGEINELCAALDAIGRAASRV